MGPFLLECGLSCALTFLSAPFTPKSLTQLNRLTIPCLNLLADLLGIFWSGALTLFKLTTTLHGASLLIQSLAPGLEILEASEFPTYGGWGVGWLFFVHAEFITLPHASPFGASPQLPDASARAVVTAIVPILATRWTPHRKALGLTLPHADPFGASSYFAIAKTLAGITAVAPAYATRRACRLFLGASVGIWLFRAVLCHGHTRLT